MLSPKQNLAMLAQKSVTRDRSVRWDVGRREDHALSEGKLFRMLPVVLSIFWPPRIGSASVQVSTEHARPHKDRIASDGHCQARKDAERHRIVDYPIPVVHCGDLQASKDDERVVVADCMSSRVGCQQLLRGGIYVGGCSPYAKAMTPTASKKPDWIMVKRRVGSPRSSAGRAGPCTMTVRTMTAMLDHDPASSARNDRKSSSRLTRLMPMRKPCRAFRYLGTETADRRIPRCILLGRTCQSA